jgi:hypothetical protein
MIKQFGYEKLVEKQIAEKRQEELAWIWKRKIVGVYRSSARSRGLRRVSS